MWKLLRFEQILLCGLVSAPLFEKYLAPLSSKAVGIRELEARFTSRPSRAY